MKKGFSLIELMIVLSIISVLSTISIYAVKKLIDKRQLSDAIGSLSSSLINAQSNSRSSGFATIICPSQNSKQCDTRSNWSYGWITYNDLDESHTLDNAEPIIAVKNNKIDDIAFTFNAPGNPQKIIFYRNGRLWPNGSFIICHTRIHEGLKIIMTQSGRVRTAAIDMTDC